MQDIQCVKTSILRMNQAILICQSRTVTATKRRILQVLNAAAALWVSGHVRDLAEGIALARETHQLGKALNTLDSWTSISNVIFAIT